MQLSLLMTNAVTGYVATNAAEAWSNEITFAFTATIDSIADAANYTELQAGDVIDGAFTFDSDTPADGATGFPNISSYLGAITGVRVDAGALQIDGEAVFPPRAIRITESSIQDTYSIFAFFEGTDICAPPVPLGIEFPAFSLLLSSSQPSDLVMGLNLPTIPPNVSLANVDRYVTLQGATCNPGFSGNFYILADVTDLTGGSAMLCGG